MKKNDLKEELEEFLADFPKAHSKVIESNGAIIVEYSLISRATSTNEELEKAGFVLKEVNPNNKKSPHQYRVTEYNPVEGEGKKKKKKQVEEEEEKEGDN